MYIDERINEQKGVERMEDEKIVELFWNRAEKAVEEAGEKYGRYCRRIAYNLLDSEPDAEECANDALLAAWHSIPPHRPAALAAYLGRLTRNLSIDRIKARSRIKRGGGEYAILLSELEECIPDRSTTDGEAERALLAELISSWLQTLPQLSRMLFVGRYWYNEPLQSLAQDCGVSVGKAKSLLFRLRKGLRERLEKEEFPI